MFLWCLQLPLGPQLIRLFRYWWLTLGAWRKLYDAGQLKLCKAVMWFAYLVKSSSPTQLFFGFLFLIRNATATEVQFFGQQHVMQKWKEKWKFCWPTICLCGQWLKRWVCESPKDGKQARAGVNFKINKNVLCGKGSLAKVLVWFRTANGELVVPMQVFFQRWTPCDQRKICFQQTNKKLSWMTTIRLNDFSLQAATIDLQVTSHGKKPTILIIYEGSLFVAEFGQLNKKYSCLVSTLSNFDLFVFLLRKKNPETNDPLLNSKIQKPAEIELFHFLFKFERILCQYREERRTWKKPTFAFFLLNMCVETFSCQKFVKTRKFALDCSLSNEFCPCSHEHEEKKIWQDKSFS